VKKKQEKKERKKEKMPSLPHKPNNDTFSPCSYVVIQLALTFSFLLLFFSFLFFSLF